MLKMAEHKIMNQVILKIIEDNAGINLYQLMMEVNRRLSVSCSYSMIYNRYSDLEKKGLIRSELVPVKVVRRLYKKSKIAGESK